MLSGEPLRGESVARFGRTAARLTAPCELPLAEHRHELNAGPDGLRRVKRFQPSHGTGDPLDPSMILFNNLGKILACADCERGAALLIITLEGRCIGGTPVDRDFLWYPTAADRLRQKAQGSRLIALCGEQKVNGVAGLLHGARALRPVAFDLDVRFVPPPTDPDSTRVAMERLFQQGAVLQVLVG